MYLWAFFKPQPLLQTHWMERYPRNWASLSTV